MEEILRAAYSRGSGDQIIKVLNNNKNILSTASENCLGGTSELLQACCVLGVEHFCALAYFLGVQSEHLQPLLFAPFMERALVFLDALSAPSSGAAQQLRNGESSKVVLCAISMVCRKLVDAAHSLGAARAVVLPLLRVMGTLCASPNTLTTLHSALMEVYNLLLI